MSFLSSIGNFFKSFGVLVGRALTHAGGQGLTDSVIAKAFELIKESAVKLSNNADRREWVVKQLMKSKLPESIARLAVELAYQLFKSEIEKLPKGTPPSEVVLDNKTVIWGT